MSLWKKFACVSPYVPALIMCYYVTYICVDLCVYSVSYICIVYVCIHICVIHVCVHRATEGAASGVHEAGGPAPRGEEEQHHPGEEAGVREVKPHTPGP